jgi:uncharacterized protein YjdB
VTVTAPTEIALTSISLNKTALELNFGSSETLSASYNPANTTETPTLIWASSDPVIAAVDSSGKVTGGNLAGTAVIMATVIVKAGVRTASCKVTVKDPSAPPVSEIPLSYIKLNKTELNLDKGKSDTLTLSYNPANTTEKPAVIWISSNSNVAAVDANGKVTGKAEGMAMITATVNAKAGAMSEKCAVTVAKPVTKVTTPLKTMYIKKGASITLPIVAYSDDGTEAKLTWSSSNEKVATVNAAGKVTPKKTGTAKITARAMNGKSATVTVKVVTKATKPTKVSISGAPKSLKKGKSAQLTVKVTPAAATNVNVTFKSSKPGVISVDKTGKITAKKKGKATITFKAGGKSAKKVVTVK